MDPWCSVSFLIHSFCFQTWKFTFKERFKANQNCRNARVYSKISVGFNCLHICVGVICISAFKRGSSLLKKRFKAGFVCIFAWDLFADLLSNVEIHFKRTLQSEPGMQGYTSKISVGFVFVFGLCDN